MTDERTAQRLRQEFAKCWQTKGFNKYPETLRDEGIAYARSRREQGARSSQIAEELGVSIATVDAWTKWRRSEVGRVKPVANGKRARHDDLSLVPVVVRPVPESGQRVLARLEVELGDRRPRSATTTGAARSTSSPRSSSGFCQPRCLPKASSLSSESATKTARFWDTAGVGQ